MDGWVQVIDGFGGRLQILLPAFVEAFGWWPWPDGEWVACRLVPEETRDA
jgi:hypothetical protein